VHKARRFLTQCYARQSQRSHTHTHTHTRPSISGHISTDIFKNNNVKVKLNLLKNNEEVAQWSGKARSV